MKVVVETLDRDFEEFLRGRTEALLPVNFSRLEEIIFIDLKSLGSLFVEVLKRCGDLPSSDLRRVIVVLSSSEDLRIVKPHFKLIDHTIKRDQISEGLKSLFMSTESMTEKDVQLAVPFELTGAYLGGFIAQSPVEIIKGSQGKFFFEKVNRAFLFECEDSVEGVVSQQKFESSFKFVQPSQVDIREYTKWLQMTEDVQTEEQGYIFPKKRQARSSFTMALISEDSETAQRLSEALSQEFSHIQLRHFDSLKSYIDNYRKRVKVQKANPIKAEFFSQNNSSDTSVVYLHPTQLTVEKLIYAQGYSSFAGHSQSEIEAGNFDILKVFAESERERIREVLFFLTPKKSVLQFITILLGEKKRTVEVLFAKKKIGAMWFVEMTINPNLLSETGSNIAVEKDSSDFDLLLIESKDGSEEGDQLLRNHALDEIKLLMTEGLHGLQFPEIWLYSTAFSGKLMHSFQKYLAPLPMSLLVQDIYVEFGVIKNNAAEFIPVRGVSETIYSLTDLTVKMNSTVLNFNSKTALPKKAILHFYWPRLSKISQFKVVDSKPHGLGFDLTLEAVELGTY